jgi:hypothetical protein
VPPPDARRVGDDDRETPCRWPISNCLSIVAATVLIVPVVAFVAVPLVAIAALVDGRLGGGGGSRGA